MSIPPGRYLNLLKSGLRFCMKAVIASVASGLPRIMRFSSRLGWTPQPWMRVEGFYSRAQQTTFLAGGDIGRNRIGVQIVTSRPVRVQ